MSKAYITRRKREKINQKERNIKLQKLQTDPKRPKRPLLTHSLTHSPFPIISFKVNMESDTPGLYISREQTLNRIALYQVRRKAIVVNVPVNGILKQLNLNLCQSVKICG